MKNDNNFCLASNIKYLRTSHNETQEELGKVIGKGFTAIGNYEQGIRNPDYLDLYKISEHYNISIDSLIKSNLRVEHNVELDKNHILETIIMDKSKELSEDDKEKLINVIDTIFDNESKK